MRAVVQRVAAASVTVDGESVGEIGPGLAVLLGVKAGDGEQDADYIAGRVLGLRVFPDEEGRMNRSLLEAGGAVLLVSQFTLYGDARKGRRPSFVEAAGPERARALYERCGELLALPGVRVATGRFGAHMTVTVVADGPVTILLDSERLF